LGCCEYSEERIEIEKATEELHSLEIQIEEREREVKEHERIDF